MARLEARKRVLAAKQDVIEAAFEKALARLCALPREKMVPLLARLAAVYAETGEEEVILPPASRRAYGQDVVDQANQLIGEGHLTLGPAEEGIAGGLLLAAGPGRYQLYLFHASAATEGIAQCPSGRDSLSPRRAGVNDG